MLQKKHRMTRLFYKEIVMSTLAILSVLLLTYEYIGSPTQSTISMIMKFDIVVAFVFLIDFFVQLFDTNNKRKFIKHNWFLLLASIPIVDSWAEVLRAFRILGLVRLVRAGEHLKYAASLSKNPGAKQSRKKYNKR